MFLTGGALDPSTGWQNAVEASLGGSTNFDFISNQTPGATVNGVPVYISFQSNVNVTNYVVEGDLTLGSTDHLLGYGPSALGLLVGNNATLNSGSVLGSPAFGTYGGAGGGSGGAGGVGGGKVPTQGSGGSGGGGGQGSSAGVFASSGSAGASGTSGPSA